MNEFFVGWHWPTFFWSLIIFVLAVNLWNFFKYKLLVRRARARGRRADAELQVLLKKLKADNQEIGDIIEKMKQPKSS